MSGVHGYLVTAGDDQKMDMWRRTACYANWLDGRNNPAGGETWHVMCFDEDSERFLDSARAASVTVQEIVGAGDDERYEIRVGEPGTGWVSA